MNHTLIYKCSVIHLNSSTKFLIVALSIFFMKYNYQVFTAVFLQIPDVNFPVLITNKYFSLECYGESILRKFQKIFLTDLFF